MIGHCPTHLNECWCDVKLKALEEPVCTTVKSVDSSRLFGVALWMRPPRVAMTCSVRSTSAACVLHMHSRGLGFGAVTVQVG